MCALCSYILIHSLSPGVDIDHNSGGSQEWLMLAMHLQPVEGGCGRAFRSKYESFYFFWMVIKMHISIKTDSVSLWVSCLSYLGGLSLLHLQSTTSASTWSPDTLAMHAHIIIRRGEGFGWPYWLTGSTPAPPTSSHTYDLWLHKIHVRYDQGEPGIEAISCIQDLINVRLGSVPLPRSPFWNTFVRHFKVWFLYKTPVECSIRSTPDSIAWPSSVVLKSYFTL